MIVIDTPPAAGTIFGKIATGCFIHWLAHDHPRFKLRTRHHAYIRIFRLKSLWTIAPSHGLDQSHELSSRFQPGGFQGPRYKMAHKRICCHDDVCAGDKYTQSLFSEPSEELDYLLSVSVRQSRKSRQGASFRAIKGWRNPPYASLPLAQF